MSLFKPLSVRCNRKPNKGLHEGCFWNNKKIVYIYLDKIHKRCINNKSYIRSISHQTSAPSLSPSPFPEFSVCFHTFRWICTDVGASCQTTVGLMAPSCGYGWKQACWTGMRLTMNDSLESCCHVDHRLVINQIRRNETLCRTNKPHAIKNESSAQTQGGTLCEIGWVETETVNSQTAL